MRAINVLCSIKPYWLYLICEGVKKTEIAKNEPKSEAWNGIVFLYCSKDMRSFNRIPDEYKEKYRPLLGKVACQFLCEKIESFDSAYSEWAYMVAPAESIMPMHEEKALKIMQEQGCLSLDEIIEYFGNEDYKAFFWHISDLKIFDKPKMLGEFQKIGALSYDEWLYGLYNGTNENCYEKYLMPFQVTRPPQSWCYVEGLRDA